MREQLPPPVPHRRWMRFSLRGLFIVMTLVAIGPAYQLNWIRQRRAALTSVQFSGDTMLAVQASPLLPKTVSAPGWLWLYGEPGYVSIAISVPERIPQKLTPDEEAEFSRVLQLFPETVQNYVKLVPPIYTIEPGER